MPSVEECLGCGFTTDTAGRPSLDVPAWDDPCDCDNPATIVCGPDGRPQTTHCFKERKLDSELLFATPVVGPPVDPGLVIAAGDGDVNPAMAQINTVCVPEDPSAWQIEITNDNCYDGNLQTVQSLEFIVLVPDGTCVQMALQDREVAYDAPTATPFTAADQFFDRNQDDSQFCNNSGGDIMFPFKIEKPKYRDLRCGRTFYQETRLCIGVTEGGPVELISAHFKENLLLTMIPRCD